MMKKAWHHGKIQYCSSPHHQQNGRRQHELRSTFILHHLTAQALRAHARSCARSCAHALYLCTLRSPRGNSSSGDESTIIVSNIDIARAHAPSGIDASSMAAIVVMDVSVVTNGDIRRLLSTWRGGVTVA